MDQGRVLSDQFLSDQQQLFLHAVDFADSVDDHSGSRLDLGLISINFQDSLVLNSQNPTWC